MHPWLIMPLALSALFLGAGLVLSERGGGVASTLCLVVGAGIGAVVLALWAARFGSVRRQTDELPSRNAELSKLSQALLTNATIAHERGVLMLADAQVPLRAELFGRGASMVVSGDAPADIRRALSEQAAAESVKAGRANARATRVCRWAPPLALLAALGTVGAATSSLVQWQALPTAGAIVLLLVVYASFMTVGLASHVQRSIDDRSRLFELAGDLVIETIVALREADPPETVARRLERILRPGTPATPSGAARKAA